MSKVAGLKQNIRQIRQKRLEQIPKICFCHVPKCAGTALVAALRDYYGPLDRLLFPNFYMDLEASGEAAAATSEAMTQVRENVLAYVLATGRYKYAGGHVPCRPRLVETFRDRWSFITVLRDPVERWISGYVYDRYKTESWSKTEMEIEEYLRSDAGIVSGRAYLWYFSNMPDDASVRDFEPYVEEAVEQPAAVRAGRLDGEHGRAGGRFRSSLRQAAENQFGESQPQPGGQAGHPPERRADGAHPGSVPPRHDALHPFAGDRRAACPTAAPVRHSERSEDISFEHDHLYSLHAARAGCAREFDQLPGAWQRLALDHARLVQKQIGAFNRGDETIGTGAIEPLDDPALLSRCGSKATTHGTALELCLPRFLRRRPEKIYAAFRAARGAHRHLPAPFFKAVVIALTTSPFSGIISPVRRRSQVARQGSAKPRSPVQIRPSPLYTGSGYQGLVPDLWYPVPRYPIPDSRSISCHRPTRRDRPHGLHAIAAITDVPVVQIHRRVAVTGDQPQLAPQFHRRGRTRHR